MDVPEPSQSSMVTIGRILKPFGVRGEVRIESLSDVPGRFEGLQTVTLVLQDGGTLETLVTSVRQINQGVILGLSAFSTPETAALYRGAWIKIPVNHNLPRDNDTFYQFELIGLRVEDAEGKPIGTLEEVLEYPQHHVFVIRNEDREILVPASRRTIAMVDVPHKILRLASREWWDATYAL
ncbi:MAG: ribosome maturation factor RimM [Nitrospirota bacterium]|nr:ribosome maturation factor RimM [Nitrospirota bacterium]MDH5698922.1 ribosome maturation factor RimM [Nitrospirota bacterium]